MVCASQFNNLLWLYSDGGRRIVAVIHAYLDESGTNAEAPVVTVAGFYGCQGQWEIFRNLWTPLIPPSGFHAKRSGRAFADLCYAIRQSAINGLFCTIGKETYNRCASAHLKTAVGNCYSICAFLCALGISREVGEPVSFVIEHGQPNVSFVNRILEAMMTDESFGVGAVAIAKKSDFVQLHPADFVSHLASAHEKPWLEHLMQTGRLKHGHITEQMLLEASPQVTQLMQYARSERKRLKEQ